METKTIVYDLDTSGGLMEQIQALLAPPKSEDVEKKTRRQDKEARRSGRATNHDTCDSCMLPLSMIGSNYAKHVDQFLIGMSSGLTSGTSKRRRKEEMTGKNMKKAQHELDHHGLVPLPVKVCFTCNRLKVWLCVANAHLNRKSMTLSKRCQIFDQFQDRISQHAVKVDFLHKVHRKHPPNRRTARPLKKRTLKVPDAIKSQYQYPPPLLAPAGIRNGELVCNGIPEPPQKHLPTSQHLASEAEQQEWLRCVIALQCSIFRHLSARQMPSSSSYWDSEKADIKPCISGDKSTGSSFHAADRTAPPCPQPCSTPISTSGTPSVLSSSDSAEDRGCSSCHEKSCRSNACGTSNGPLEPQSKVNGPHSCSAVAEGCRQTDAHQGLPATPSPTWLRPQTPPSLQNHVAGPVIKTENATGPSACAQRGPVAAISVPASPSNSCANMETISSSSTSSGVSLQLRSVTPLSTGGQSTALTSRSMTSPAAGTRAVTPPRATAAPPDSALAKRLASPAPPTDGKVSASTLSTGSSSSFSAFFSSSSSAMADLASSMKALIEGNGEIELSKLDEKFIKLLAWQRIQQLFPPKALPQQQSRVSPPQRAPSPSPSPSPSPAPHTEAQKKEVQARAVFYPLMGKGGAVNMCYRTLYIGTGADMDVCLADYGHCNYVSGKHACIFYDENTKHYELLNYSEHGTTVDNVLYSCDFSEKSLPAPSSSVVFKVQNVIRRCKKRKQEEELQQQREAAGAGLGAGDGEGEVVGMGVMSCQAQGPHRTPCNCKASSSSLIGGSGAGWEGTALLHHGSYIKLGCLQFVFSITEFAGKQPVQEEAAADWDEKHSQKLHQAPVLRSNSVP
ncbi:UNVERIFIED_CONTAM: hypothetical protein FKN15_076071 [Acipenser sinensis]